MNPPFAVAVTLDTLDEIAGKLLVLEGIVADDLDADDREHVRTELSTLRRNVMIVGQLLSKERLAR